MKCSEFYEKISEFIDGGLSESNEKEMRAHMEKCPECRARYDAYTALSDAVKDTRTSSLPPEFAKEITKKATKTDIPYLLQKYNKTAAVLVAAFAVVIFARGARVNKEFLEESTAPKPEIITEFAAPVISAEEKDENDIESAQEQVKEEKAETAELGKAEEEKAEPAEIIVPPPQSEEKPEAAKAPEEAVKPETEDVQMKSSSSVSEDLAVNSTDSDSGEAVSDDYAVRAKSADGNSASNARRGVISSASAPDKVLSYSLPSADSFESDEEYAAFSARLNSLKAKVQNGEDVSAEFDAFLSDVNGAMK